MATYVKKTVIKLHLNDGKTATINLPECINEQLIDPDNASSLVDDAFDKIKAAYRSDTGATVQSADFYTVTTATNTVAENFVGE